MAKFNRFKTFLPYLFILLVGGFILTKNITKPFIGHHDWNGVFYSNIARNYLRYGLLTSKLGQVTSHGYIQSDSLSFYTHYPPLMPLLLALFFKVLGVSDLSARLFTAMFTLSGLLIIYRLSRRLNMSLPASLAGLAIVFTPMLRFFGLMPSQEALMVFFTLLSVDFYLDLVKKPTKINQAKFYLSVVLNGLSGWAGYFIYPLLFIHSRFKAKSLLKVVRKAILLLVIIFILHLAHIYILTGSIFGGGIIDALLLRLNLYPLLGKTTPELPGQFSWLNYLKKEISWLKVYYTATLLAACLVSFSLIVGRLIKKITLKPIESIILLFLGFGFSYPLIFSNVVFVHEYFNIFFWPFITLALIYLMNVIYLKHKLIGLIVIIALSGTIYLERLEFFKALNQTQAHQPAFKLGTLINQSSPKHQPVFIVAPKIFNITQNIFVSYYADRQIEYVSSPDQLPINVKNVFYYNDEIK
ncbi:glycosyltransferase family 39 protein [Patescibacteria group bacterium]|nr:glycosyltransferase family 39 protein [Patescibacteria group bacterium]MBU1499860.1 glycosyltransferase family 39 protein [Patescibacteria group bacterium]